MSMSPSFARIAPAFSVQASPAKAAANKRVHSVVLGDILFRTWYPSYYPDELVGKEVERLYICQWCFKYSKERVPYLGHLKTCIHKGGPPGVRIYANDSYDIYEVDGEEHQLYAQNLSLFAKLFLDNKSVFFDVIGFYYYLLVHTPKRTASPDDSQDHRIVGFFSKEKMSWDNNNLACILIFPPWQRQGLGKILMGASYELSRREGQTGGPEKPLSELGRKGYHKFWQARLARTILGIKNRNDALEALRDMDILGPKKRKDGGLTINKAKVKEWVRNHHVDLCSPVMEHDFLIEDIRSSSVES